MCTTRRTMLAVMFAALDTATGEVYGLCQQRHRHQEWLKFLRLIDQTIAAEKQIHIICDNYATHKHPVVQRWLGKTQTFPCSLHAYLSLVAEYDRALFP